MIVTAATWEGLVAKYPALGPLQQGMVKAARTGTALELVLGMVCLGIWQSSGEVAAIPADLRPTVIFYLLSAFIKAKRGSQFTDADFDMMLGEADAPGEGDWEDAD